MTPSTNRVSKMSYDSEQREEAIKRKQYAKKSDAIAQLISAIPKCNYSVDVGFDDIEWMIEKYRTNYDGFEENPDFQRGWVWTREQQIAFIESYIRGGVGDTTRTITLSCPDFQRDQVADSDLKGFVIIDGLQRITAIRQFMKDEFTVFNDVVEGGVTKDFFNGSRFNLKSQQGVRFNVMNFQYKSELLDYYLAINAGGTVHTKEELNRVRKMRDQLK